MITDTVIIGCDHAGVDLKTSIKNYLTSQNITLIDCGTNNEESVDYPDFGQKVAKTVIDTPNAYGILICGSGIGISIAANRYPQIRAALCHQSELAKLSRQHNNANILALGARFIDQAEALRCVKTFLTTEFEGGRHQNRVEKLSINS